MLKYTPARLADIETIGSHRLSSKPFDPDQLMAKVRELFPEPERNNRESR
jgi:hypothetical protein